jgi:hypothetical protein
MLVDRRKFVAALAGSALAGPNLSGTVPAVASDRGDSLLGNLDCGVPAYSVVPVVGDGKWIWNEPPREGRGVLEPRRFRLRVGVEITARGPTVEIVSSTPVPSPFPEQLIDAERIITSGGALAEFDAISDSARRLVVTHEKLQKGQTASAVAEIDLTLYKQYYGFRREQFPERQVPQFAIRTAYLGDSPGIQTRIVDVVERARSLRAALTHPWDWAEAFADWVSRNISPRIGVYTSVTKAMETRVGDCEEMAGVFVALCRASGVPARLVWVPNHVWSEFYLVDAQGTGHWIPVHTACYSWFGWTGAHELVLQKGDRLKVPGYGTLVRLQQDRTRALGSRPDVQYIAELTPLPPADDDKADPGPGARRKMPTGEWVIAGEHPADRYLRR